MFILFPGEEHIVDTPLMRLCRLCMLDSAFQLSFGAKLKMYSNLHDNCAKGYNNAPSLQEYCFASHFKIQGFAKKNLIICFKGACIL